MDREEVTEEAWDIKRIVIGIGAIILFIVGGVYIKDTYFPLLFEENKMSNLSTGEVAGESIEENNQPRYSVSNLNSDIREKIESLKDQANSLDSSEVATSSPQVQKVINDLKNLQQYPKNQMKEACINICRQL